MTTLTTAEIRARRRSNMLATVALGAIAMALFAIL